MYTRFAAFCEDVHEFDRAAFRLPRNEAIGIDPQQRILLEQTAQALANAGEAASMADGHIGDTVVCSPLSSRV